MVLKSHFKVVEIYYFGEYHNSNKFSPNIEKIPRNQYVSDIIDEGIEFNLKPLKVFKRIQSLKEEWEIDERNGGFNISLEQVRNSMCQKRYIYFFNFLSKAVLYL